MVEFNHKINTSDPFLYDKIEANFDVLHRKLVSLYLSAAREVGHKDIWAPDMLPHELLEFRARMRRSVDPLCAFLDSGIFNYDDSPTAYCDYNQFKELYNSYVRENNLVKERWCPDFYLATFNDKGLCIGKKKTSRGGTSTTVTVIHGLEIYDCVNVE